MLTVKKVEPQSSGIQRADWKCKRSGGNIRGPADKNSHLGIFLALFPVLLAAMSVQANSQSVVAASDISGQNEIGQAAVNPDFIYVRPTPRITVKKYTFDAFGPYAFVGTALIAGLDQTTNTPPEWKQGFGGYANRFESDFGIAFVGTTARYGLAKALKEDTSYYPCECRGVFPRIRHAALSTFTARRGETGHRVFSFPALVAPYAGVATAVYGWYPNRYGVKDALRMGNYSLLESIGGNIALEFLYSGPHALISRVRLSRIRGASDPGLRR